MELQQVDVIAAEAAEALLEGPRDSLGEVLAMLGQDGEFGAEEDRGLQVAEHAAQVLLRGAVAVGGRGIEIVNAALERPCDGALLVPRRAPHHETADRAASEAEDRDRDAGTAQDTLFHW